jgi:hypothetical protein
MDKELDTLAINLRTAADDIQINEGRLIFAGYLRKCFGFSWISGLGGD